MIVNLKIFKISHIDSAFIKWLLFGFFLALTPSNIALNLAEILIRDNTKHSV